MTVPTRRIPLNIAHLQQAYREGASPVDVVESALATITDHPVEGIWIHRRGAEELRSEARELELAYPPGRRPPLFGVPFAVKDSIDVAGIATTVACPDFAYVPTQSATVVERLRASGALLMGKVNLDQFATGLVGVRSPYGIPPNAFDARYVTGGSSSGSAGAVTRGQVSFALSTDTAGSGRVPAAFNNVVGFKPSRGLLSTHGLVPACQSIDCMSITAFTCDDARQVASAVTGFDPKDPFSRREAASMKWPLLSPASSQRLGIPRDADLTFGDAETSMAFTRACSQLEAMGFAVERIDMAPFFEAGQLLYAGPWVAERLAGLEAFVREHPASVLPVIRSILADGERYKATDAFRGLHRLAALRSEIAPIWSHIEALCVPSVPTHPRIDEVLADPLAANARLGKYTTFANLLDLSGVAVPAPFRVDGLPSGVTFLGPWGRDASLLSLAAAFHAASGVTLGATGWPLPPSESAPMRVGQNDFAIAVVGAHLSGEPLNRELTDRGGRLLRSARTAPCYRLYTLRDTHPPKPGMVRVSSGEGARIAIEVWALPVESVGSFVAGVRSPLAIGTIETDEGDLVHGFLSEAWAVEGARDISSFGGWRNYLRVATRA